VACERRGKGYVLTSPKQWYEAAIGTNSYSTGSPGNNDLQASRGSDNFDCNIKNTSRAAYTGLEGSNHEVRFTGTDAKNAIIKKMEIRDAGDWLSGYRCVSKRGVYDMIGNVSEYVRHEALIAPRTDASIRFIRSVNPFTKQPRS